MSRLSVSRGKQEPTHGGGGGGGGGMEGIGPSSMQGFGASGSLGGSFHRDRVSYAGVRRPTRLPRFRLELRACVGPYVPDFYY